MNAGRNDACPCGSGKKYKKCCLDSHERAARSSHSGVDADPRERALLELGRWVARPELAAVRRAAFDTFSGGDARPDDEPVEDEEAKFLSYYCFDHPLEDGRSVADLFLDQAGGRLEAEERRAVERLITARLRPYQVTEVVLDEGLGLRDLWSEERLFVRERSATHQLQRWDLLATRITRFGDRHNELDGGAYLFPIGLKDGLLALLRKAERAVRKQDPSVDDDYFWRVAAPVIHAFWLARVVFAARPTMVTAEGDRMEFGRIVFDVVDVGATRTALDACPALDSAEDGHWSWLEEAKDSEFGRRGLAELHLEGSLLTLEVTSRPRGLRGRRLVEEVAGSAVRHRSTRYESVEKALAKHRARPWTAEPEPSIPPEEAARFMAEYKERHFRTWPDTALPALDGRTPRAAARLKSARPKLVDLLCELENHETHAARPDNPPYDLGWIWTELGLERQA